MESGKDSPFLDWQLVLLDGLLDVLLPHLLGFF